MCKITIADSGVMQLSHTWLWLSKIIICFSCNGLLGRLGSEFWEGCTIALHYNVRGIISAACHESCDVDVHRDLWVVFAEMCLQTAVNLAVNCAQGLAQMAKTIKWITYRLLLAARFCFLMPAMNSSSVDADARISKGSKSSMSKLTGSWPYGIVSECVWDCEQGILQITLHSEASNLHHLRTGTASQPIQAMPITRKQHE